MATTFRSHFRHPPQNHDAPSQTQRKPSSRIPTKPTSSNSDGKQSKAAQHVSRLAKRASRSITPSDKIEDGTQSTGKAVVAVTSVHNVPAASKRASVVPPSDPNAAGISTVLSSRQNGVLAPPQTIRTPSLISGSSASTFDSPRTTGLRRKPSTIEKYAALKRAETPSTEADGTTMYRGDDDMKEAFEDSVFGISLPQSSSYVHNGAFVAANPKYRMPDDFEGYPAIQPVTRDITPPVPNYAQSATPSTRYTDSPFSHVPTPSSCSSYSPAVVIATSGTTPQLRQQSPTRNVRPPVTTRSSDKGNTSRLGLPPVRESSTSSSNSTVKPAARTVTPREPPRKPATAPPAGKTSDAQRPPSRGKLVKERPKQGPTRAVAESVQIPPELAHLNVETPSKPALNKPLPPLRPSRDGTPTLTGISNPSPVVQSDLPKLYTTYHKRTPSQETPPALSPLKSRFGLSPKGTSKNESPRIDSAVSPPPASRTFSRGQKSDGEARDMQPQRPGRKDSPAIGPVRSPSKSPRFGFFSRKPKEISKPAEKPKRQQVKGPAAGTGHEGYGRFGFRGRSGSNTSSTGFRSPSADSSASSLPKRLSTGRKSSASSKDGSDLDDFLRERLNPVVLRGSGSTFSNVESNSDNQPPSVPNSSKTSSLEGYPPPQLLPSAMSSSAGISPSKRPLSSSRKPSDSSEDDVAARYPTLAGRRSLTRLSQSDGKSPVRMPAPIDTGRPLKNAPMDSYEGKNSAWPRTDSTMPMDDPFEGREGLWLKARPVEPEPKPSRKWNFFQRAQASPRTKGKAKVGSTADSLGTVAHSSPYRGVAHYAMLDPVEPVPLEDVERILQENETSPEDSMSESNGPPKVVPYERRHTSLLPSPPKPEFSQDRDFRARPNLPRITVRHDSSESPELLRAQQVVRQEIPQMVDIKRSPIIPEASETTLALDGHRQDNVHTPDMSKRSLETPENQVDISPQRIPRLSPVGRIPKVISKRDRDRKLSDSSFSRPFVRTQPKPSVKPPGSLYNQIRELASPIESGSQPVSSTSTRSDQMSGEQKSSVNTDPPSISTNRTSMDVHANAEFFAFPPRKDSDLSHSSSSGNYSWTAALAAHAAQEDDIWNEYNDLLDEVMIQRTPLSTSSSLGAPFQYSGVLQEPDTFAQAGSMPYQFPPPPSLPPTTRIPKEPAILSVPQQIRRYMQPSMSPLTTPNALSDVFDHYGNRSTSTLISQNRTGIPAPTRSSLAQSTRSSIPGPARSSLARTSRSSLASARGSVVSSRHSRASAHSRSASLPEANARNSQSSLTPSARFIRDTQLLDIAEVDGDESSIAANLRFGALMTSKWLSFGRVLFSPAHDEMSLFEERRILVIDGLGSDWSYYVSLSYPTARVANLGPSTSPWPGVHQPAPGNHNIIGLKDISEPFPFPKAFFSAVVFRFPSITTEKAYQSAIFECKRVLRPGGYLEVAVLDLDLMNMGNRARKAVRELKTRMHANDPNVCLRNVSDVVLRQIGRRGFEEVQRCIVGVPAAGRIPRSQDMSSISSGHSGKPIWHREDRHSQEFSFADLLEDARASQIGPGKNNDENITKMVAKVGRWWYSSCYEKSLQQCDNSSIWNEPGLLRECEKQGTSFRLLICHAQKPTHNRRRTVSV